MSDLILSDKYKVFLKHQAQAEALEGTTAAGKTTVGAFKFMLKVAQSDKKLHFIASKTVGDAEKNIINSDLGIIDIFGEYVSYRGNGDANYKIPHLKYTTSKGERVIFILGYGSRDKWEKALGSQFGCGYIDEINTADIDFVQESTMRCDYWMCTMNPDDPSLPVYSGYINRFRPLERYENDTPPEIQSELSTALPRSNWTYWFFNFDHNAGLSNKKKEQIKSTVAPGTKLYKNKILGLRGRSEGLVFSIYQPARNVITEAAARKMTFVKYSCGVDTSYSQKSEDTISFIYQGLSSDGKLVVLEERVYNNKDFTDKTISPSDVAEKLHRFLDYCKDKWGFGRTVYVDNADQATITELNKYKRQHGLVYEFMNAVKTVKIIDRITLQIGWMKDGNYLIVDHCKEHIREIESYSWQEDKDMPEDRNDHTINASQYGWIPHRAKIGKPIQANNNDYRALVAGLRG
ncbi:terminase large subunit domain-containing protein [Streptococcus porci]|uniref:terminase large subunit domain-containing protein n=1 Tax=Streptococcus porci TaxID=502567 RepID=UPI000402694A|nr:terminase family protein [Streptococcus porci]